jgi:hypothetical protein
MPSDAAYSPPQLRKRTFEQVALFLTGYAWIGNQEATDLLELLFPEPEMPYGRREPGGTSRSV